jgi:hypothetical protein
MSVVTDNTPYGTQKVQIRRVRRSTGRDNRHRRDVHARTPRRRVLASQQAAAWPLHVLIDAQFFNEACRHA